LDAEEPSSSSFLDMLNQETINLDSLPKDANQWLDDLIAHLEEPPPPETADSCRVDEDNVMDWLDDLIEDLEDPSFSSLENTVDVNDLFRDVENNDDWEHDWNMTGTMCWTSLIVIFFFDFEKSKNRRHFFLSLNVF